jgi:tetratricopeptide (TPR) repeat protein
VQPRHRRPSRTNKESVEDFNEAIKLNPKYAEAYCLRARSKIALNQLNEALADAKMAADLSPNYAEAFYYQSQALFKLGKKSDSINAINKALEFSPGNTIYTNYKSSISN